MKKEILKLINKDIEIQKNFLTGEFEEDKVPKWRIIGMKKLKKDINRIK